MVGAIQTSYRTAYVAFDTDAPAPLTVAGKLRAPRIEDVPDGGGPAVVICHGSDGVDGRGEFHAGALNAAGIATLEIDMWAAPILILTGETDTHDAPDSGEKLVQALRAAGGAPVGGVTYGGAGHGFDRDLPAQTIVDAFAHQGAGGPVVMAFHRQAAEAARAEAVRFFADALRAT